MQQEMTKGEVTLPSAVHWWYIPASPLSGFQHHPLCLKGSILEGLVVGPSFFGWDVWGAWKPFTPVPRSHLASSWVKPMSRIWPLVSIRNVLVQSPKCGWKRVWGEEKGLERETAKEVGGHYRVPGMGQGLRQENGGKRTYLKNSTERKQTWGDLRSREWRGMTANACQWITRCATRLILIKFQVDHSLTLACFGFILRPHTRQSVYR